jgi:hypothetical protein
MCPHPTSDFASPPDPSVVLGSGATSTGISLQTLAGNTREVSTLADIIDQVHRGLGPPDTHDAPGRHGLASGSDATRVQCQSWARVNP